MPKFKYNGKTYSVPEGTTPEEIQHLVDAEERAHAETTRMANAPQEKSLWEKVNTGMISPSSVIKSVTGGRDTDESLTAEMNAPPTVEESEHPTLSGIRRGALGLSRDTLRQVSGLTSPLSVGTLALGGAGKVAQSVEALRAAQLIKATETATAAGFGAKGVSDLSNEDLSKWQEPDTAGRILQSSGMAVGGLGGVAHGTKGIAPNLASKIMNTKLDISPEALKYSNPGEAVVKEGLYGSTPKLAEKIEGARDAVGRKIDPTLQAAKQRGVSIDMDPTLDPVRDTMGQAFRESNLGTHNKALDFLNEKTREPLIDPTTGKAEVGPNPRNMTMDPVEATTMKRGIGRQRWTGEPDSGTLENSRRQVYGKQKEAINTAVPEVAPLNDRYAGLNEASEAISPDARQSQFGLEMPRLSDYVVGGAFGGATGLLDTGGGMSHWVPAAIGGMLTKKVLGSMPVASRAAYWLGNQEAVEGGTPHPSGPPTMVGQPPRALPPAGSVQAPPSPIPGPTGLLTGNAPGVPRIPQGSIPAEASPVKPPLALRDQVLEGEYMPEPTRGTMLPPGSETEGPFHQPESPVGEPAALPSARGRKLSTVIPATKMINSNLDREFEQGMQEGHESKYSDVPPKGLESLIDKIQWPAEYQNSPKTLSSQVGSGANYTAGELAAFKKRNGIK